MLFDGVWVSLLCIGVPKGVYCNINGCWGEWICCGRSGRSRRIEDKVYNVDNKSVVGSRSVIRVSFVHFISGPVILITMLHHPSSMHVLSIGANCVGDYCGRKIVFARQLFVKCRKELLKERTIESAYNLNNSIETLKKVLVV